MRCSCGKETTVIASRVRAGKTKSCGHLRALGLNKRHGQRRTRLYSIWCNMRARCNNALHPAYKNYGGRGIRVHPLWEDFLTFADDVGPPPTPTATLDRIDNELGYFPGNVRWVGRQVQSRNTRQNRWITIGHETHCLKDWCARLGIAPASVYRRVKQGESFESAILRPKVARFQRILNG
jgi:hypothetical protein